MKIGYHPGRFDGPAIADELLRNVTAAEEAGVHSLWFMDHLFQIEVFGRHDEPMLEVYSTLAWTAAHTERVHLGALVTAVPYRAPGLLMKTATTLDVLSGGRAWLGIGAAWNDFEARSLGLPFPPLVTRFEQLEEALQIADRMFSGDTEPFIGRQFRLENPLNRPEPIRRPPIMIGGVGEKKTLRLVARYADATNMWESVVESKLEVLRSHCEREGRRFEDIVVTTTGSLDPGWSLEQAVDHYGRLADAGVDMAIVAIPRDPFHRHAEFVAEVVEAVAGLGRPTPPQLEGAPGGVRLQTAQA
ncbi:MAG: TIGR03560 family F420-dependent LLM class oxidoreductase [Actinomycetes bacterium]|jgi:F420-dependent oxidoreductase-like protein|nr:TIGR03560 family F420-dependent LLM class oxidoreductase [Acidimicrobiia bacterium]